MVEQSTTVPKSYELYSFRLHYLYYFQYLDEKHIFANVILNGSKLANGKFLLMLRSYFTGSFL